MKSGPLSLIALAAAPALAADAPGCKDYPLFNRMPSYQITACEDVTFDAVQFPSGADGSQSVTVEGRKIVMEYMLQEGAKPASALQVHRNFEAAVLAAKGTVLGTYDTSKGHHSPLFDQWDRVGVYQLRQGAREIWVQVMAADYPGYKLRIVERQAMKQDIAANELLDRINKDGFVALYINFDTGKSVIKPDSLTQLDQVAAMLKSTPALKLEIGGHTDNVGGEAANQKLSEARARSVMATLVERGTDAQRLTAKGYGQSAPVADNRTEEGRAKNRRVELSKK